MRMRRPAQHRDKKMLPDSMPWILWNSPVEVRPRERAARPGSLREVCGVTQSTKFPDERSRRERATAQAVASSEPRGSLVNFHEGVDSVVRGGRPVLRCSRPLPEHRRPSGVAGMACADSSSGHHGRAWPVDDRSPTAAYKAIAEVAVGLARQSERPIVPSPGGGQQNRRRGKGPYSHHASDGESPGGLP